jgi:hypothetical protein
VVLTAERASNAVDLCRYLDKRSMLLFNGISSKILFVVPLMATFDTFVKYRHRFIGGSDLNLHKVRLVVITGGTDGHGTINIFPGCGTS